MGKIAVRAILNKAKRVYGKTTDRFILGDSVVNLDFSQLSLLDSKRAFRFYDRKINLTKWKAAVIVSELESTNTAFSNLATSRLMSREETLASDIYSPPFFFSGNLASPRSTIGSTTGNFVNLLGKFKGPDPVFTVDDTGNAGDFLPPGTKLMVSWGGVIHKYTPQGSFDIIEYPVSTTACDFIINGNLSGLPMSIGWNAFNAPMAYPLAENRSAQISYNAATAGISGKWAFPSFVALVHQDATYIVFAQWTSHQTGAADSRYDGTQIGPPDKLEFVAIRKSDGYQYDILLSASTGDCKFSGCSFNSVTTTEATPQKAWAYLYTSQMTGAKKFYLNKIIGATATAVGNVSFTNNTYAELYPTQFMENNNPSFSGFWKVYYPMYGYSTESSNLNSLTFQYVRFNKSLTQAPITVPCVLSGIPLEYCSANGDGTKLKAINTTKSWAIGKFDIAFAAEIYDGGKQYIAYWIGRTRSGKYNTDIDASSYSEMSDTQYRWMLVFEVNATDDSKLSYVSCVPEFKFAKPMYCYAASADNKYLVTANDDGVYCMVWSSSTKGYICTDILALPGVMSIGMDGTQPASKATVFVEVVDNPLQADNCNSSLYQIDFGNYEDVDLRFFNGVSYVYDFGSNSLPLSINGDGSYNSQTATIQLRVKNRVDGVETAFVSDKSVKLTISGVRDSDGVSFVGHDTGNNYVKTISTTGDWLDVVFNYKQPIPQMKIVAEIV